MSAKQRKSLDKVREWNREHAIGTIVVYFGKTFKTWSPAALNFKNDPCVFLDSKDYLEPVLLSQLEFPDKK